MSVLAIGASLLAAPVESGRATHTGTIDGAKYRVETPDRWNGTLLLFSHGYHPEGFPVGTISLTNHPKTEKWLLDRGYALAASQYKDGGYGYQTENAMTDQLALLDWVEKKIGKPKRTVATGQSMGAVAATLLAERNPGRFAGAMNVCGNFDALGSLNAELDVLFAVKTLLAPGKDIDLVGAEDPDASAKALADAVEAGTKTPEGRARLALAGAFNNVSDWYSTHGPRPRKVAERIRQQAKWVMGSYAYGYGGPSGQADLAARAGGNPASNTGVDYGRQLAQSAQKKLVKQAYEAAGLSLRGDLKQLASAERVAADPEAVAYLKRYGVPKGNLKVPMITAHNTGDGGTSTDQENWYAKQVRDPGNLRQVYVGRGSHCALSAAEEIVTLRTLLTRIDTGKWPTTKPSRMNAAAHAVGDGYQAPLDFLTGVDRAMLPAFTKHDPPRTLRPTG
ncbi:DUF6351 family protein [Nonomuraea sp. NPDC049655]|uniref:DUF6351 family protein n=1 Tax=Nonomuraea sp. NPDC049655 TaxID=3364355 RepID=UPI003792F417